MPAPRACRDCDAELPADVRWCTRCYAPVMQFAPRERLHDGFVGMPWHDHDDSGHWSRWEKSPTTLGPAGRLGGTIFILAWLVSGVFDTFVVFWFAELFLGGWLIHDLWKPGWVVSAPFERRNGTDAPEPLSEGFRVPRPERSLPVERTPIPGSTIVTWLALGMAVIGGTACYISGDEVMKMIVTTSATLLATYFFFRSFLR